MKLAILCPIRRKIIPGQEGTLENRIWLLAGELEKLGVEVSLMAAGGSRWPGVLVDIAPKPLDEEPPADAGDFEIMALCRAFSYAGGFDLIHNFLGPKALPFAAMTKTPMIHTLDYSSAGDNGSIFRKFAKSAIILSEGSPSASGASDDDYPRKITVIPHGAPEQAAREYLKVYQQVLSQRENYRPWGHYENLAEGADHKIKRIMVSPGARLSYQKHKRRAERWIVISGHAVVTLEGREIPLQSGETVYIPKDSAHRVYNPGSEPLVFAEVQLGDYFGEDDIIRLQDDYGR